MSSSEVCSIWKIDQDNYTTVIILPVQLPLTSLPTDAFYSLVSLLCFALLWMQCKMKQKTVRHTSAHVRSCTCRSIITLVELSCWIFLCRQTKSVCPHPYASLDSFEICSSSAEISSDFVVIRTGVPRAEHPLTTLLATNVSYWGLFWSTPQTPRTSLCFSNRHDLLEKCLSYIWRSAAFRITN